jgi:hypothetical protein
MEQITNLFPGQWYAVAAPKDINPGRVRFTEFHVSGPLQLVIVTLAGPRLPRKLKKAIKRRFAAPVKWERQ